MNNGRGKSITARVLEPSAGGDVSAKWTLADGNKVGVSVQDPSVGFSTKFLATALVVGTASIAGTQSPTKFSDSLPTDLNVASTTFSIGARTPRAENAAVNELQAPRVYKDMGGEISRMRHDLIAVNRAVQALSIQTAAIQVALAAASVTETNLIDSTYPIAALEQMLSHFDPRAAGDLEADALDQAAELGLRSTTVTIAARAGLQAVDSLVRAAAGRALAVSNQTMAAELLPAAIEAERNETVRLIMASALRTALIG